MIEQGDLFSENVWDVKPPITQAADASRIITHTCWAHCGHCDPEYLTQSGKGSAKRVYRVCKRTGEKTYAASKLCEWTDFFGTPAAKKPHTQGWDDY